LTKRFITEYDVESDVKSFYRKKFILKGWLMKNSVTSKFLLVVLMLWIRPVFSQSGISENICRHYEGIFVNVILNYRAQGFPIRHALDAFNNEQDLDTRMFFWSLTKEIYENPSAGRQYLYSGKFRADCIKVNRGF